MTRLALLIGTVLGVSAASAQSSRPVASDSTHRTALSVNPLLIPFGGVTVEAERATGARASVGASVNYFSPWFDDGGDDDEGLLSVDVKARFYPNEQALRGFAIGVSAGFMRISDVVTIDCTINSCRSGRRTTTSPTIAVLADYNWFLGRRRDFLVGIGVGAKRVLRGDEIDWWIPRFFPNLRFQTGFRF